MIGFEWDEAKRLRNIEDHGVDFREAARIFANPVIESEDDRSDHAEARIRALGHVGEDYYLVVYTWRGDIRRIISAWRIGDDGRKRYQAVLARRS